MNIEKFFEKVINQKAKINENMEFILEEIYKTDTIEMVFKKLVKMEEKRHHDIFVRILQILLKIDDENVDQK